MTEVVDKDKSEKKSSPRKKKMRRSKPKKKTLSREQLLAVLIKECKASNLLDNEKNPPKKKTKVKKNQQAG